MSSLGFDKIAELRHELAASQNATVTLHIGINSLIKDKIVSMCYERVRNSQEKAPTFWGDTLHSMLAYMAIRPDPKNQELLTAFVSRADLDRLRLTSGKPAKMLGKILPHATQREKEDFAVWWKETLVLPNEGLTVKSTKDGEEIARIYTADQARASDPCLSANGWKSLSASCMRYDFDHLKQHPVTVYGSGDFELFYVENAKGEIAARAMVAIRNGRFVPAPIYTNSNLAGKMLQDHLNAWENAPRVGKDVESSTWINCRILRVEDHGGGLIAPYFDVYAHAKESQDGETLIICKSGSADFELRETSGVIGYNGCECYECGARISEDDSFYDGDGDSYCECCFHELFAYCESCHETERRDNMESVLDEHDHPQESYCRYCLENGNVENVLEVDGQFYDADAVIFDVDDSPHVIGSGSYFVSDLSGEIYAMEDRHELPNGDECTLSEALETGNWLLVTERVFKGTRTLYDGTTEARYETTRSLVLKPWLELTDSGEVINRQPELFPDTYRDGESCDSDGEADFQIAS